MRRLLPVVLVVLLVAGCAAGFAQRREISRPMVVLAVNHIQNGDLQRALVELNRAERENPQDPEVHYHLAIAYRLADKPDKALDHVGKAVRHGRRLWDENPGMRSEALNLKGVILFERQDYAAAATVWSQVLEDDLYSTPERTLFNLGQVYLAQKNYPAARHAFRDSLDRDSHYAPSWFKLAQIDSLEGAYEQAVEALQHAVLEFPEYVEAHWEMAQLYLKLGDTAGAIAALREVMRLEPDGLLGAMAAERLQALED